MSAEAEEPTTAPENVQTGGDDDAVMQSDAEESDPEEDEDGDEDQEEDDAEDSDDEEEPANPPGRTPAPSGLPKKVEEEPEKIDDDAFNALLAKLNVTEDSAKVESDRKMEALLNATWLNTPKTYDEARRRLLKTYGCQYDGTVKIWRTTEKTGGTARAALVKKYGTHILTSSEKQAIRARFQL